MDMLIAKSEEVARLSERAAVTEEFKVRDQLVEDRLSKDNVNKPVDGV